MLVCLTFTILELTPTLFSFSLSPHPYWPTRHLCGQAALLFEQIAGVGYPAVVCLQEVTRRFADILSASSLCAANDATYCMVIEPDLGPLKPMVTVLLIRRACLPDADTPPLFQRNGDDGGGACVRHMPFTSPDDDMDRGVLACVLPAPTGWSNPLSGEVSGRGGGGGGGSKRNASASGGNRYPPVVVVATTHLESPEPGRDNFHTRRRQCNAALAFVKELAEEVDACAAVLAGDFNATRAEDEDAMIPRQWEDVWLHLHGSGAGAASPGYTYDCCSNTHAVGYQSRLDKVLLLHRGTTAETKAAAAASSAAAARVHANTGGVASAAVAAAAAAAAADDGRVAADTASATKYAKLIVGDEDGRGSSGSSSSSVVASSDSTICIVASAVALVGTEPEDDTAARPPPDPDARCVTPPPPVKRLYASDHYGLHATFSLSL